MSPRNLIRCQKLADLCVDILGRVPAAGAGGDASVPVDQEIRREAHIDVAVAIFVRVLQHDAESVRQNTKIERVFPDEWVHLDLVVHRHTEENNFLTLVVLDDLVEFRDLRMADRTAGGPKGKYYDLALQLVEAVGLPVEGLVDEIRCGIAGFQGLLRGRGHGQNQT